MPGFRYHRGMGLSYERQGYVYFVCRSFSRLGKRQQARILKHAESVCGDHAAAVIALVTSGDSYKRVAGEHYVSVNTLYRAVTRFYKKFPL